MQPVASVRLDKWLWAVRIYKSRSLATAACSAGKVQVQGHPAKASRAVHIGEIIVAATEDITRTVKVLALLEKRVAGKLVADFAEDLTPASEYARRREPLLAPIVFRPKGAGRPTKKDRRAMNEFLP
jgi:ribosome-associated heat shock protein Hsp15